MLHKQVEATATPTIEKGTAVLLVAAYSRDRGNDVIQRGAFRDTTERWRGSGKQIPLAWDHATEKAEQVIGTVDPHSMRETRDGLIAEAHLDLDGSETAREVWRLVKSDSVGVSFGYLVTDQEDGPDDTRLLKAIDLFEVSLTATPMNEDTRVVSWKSAAPEWTEADSRKHERLIRGHTVAGEKTEEKVITPEMEEEIRVLAAEYKAEKAKAARKARPIKVARFKVL
jgi:HK97 family phage prohead protease